MNFFKGIKYNYNGLMLGLKTPKLLTLGVIRFAAVLFLTLLSAAFILVYHEQILATIWSQPETPWLLVIWQIFSWILSLLLTAVSSVLSYLISQILFSVLIMDYMSRITEKIITGSVEESKMPLLTQFGYLVKQEIPRAMIPVLVSLVILAGGWLTPFGPVFAVVASIVSILFLAWDNTDLIPARQFIPFSERFMMFRKNILFHLGFGLWFLIPLLNILFLSFAPVGATLYHLDSKSGR